MTSTPRTPRSRPVNWIMQALSLFAFAVATLGVSILIFEVFNEPAFSLNITGIFALLFIIVGIIVIHVTPRVRGFASWGLDLLLGVAFSPLFLSLQETTLVGWKRMGVHILSYFVVLYVMSVYFNRRYPTKVKDSQVNDRVVSDAALPRNLGESAPGVESSAPMYGEVGAPPASAPVGDDGTTKSE
ncbi:hypothetical protein I6E29_02480 [Arcanobacterium haemolyticum]|nr:hypothetical protein [Arcanobacterium haemolyticum]